VGSDDVFTLSQPSETSWTRLEFQDSYEEEPVVIPSLLTSSDSAPAEVVLSDVTLEGIDVQIGEWDYQDGVHGNEQISLFLLNAGLHDLGGLEAVASKGVTESDWVQISFDHEFAERPVVLAHLVSEKEDVTAVVRVRNVSTTGFEIKYQVEEFLEATVDGSRVFHYVAIEEGSGLHNSKTVIVGKTGRLVTHEAYEVTYGELINSPTFYAQDQSSRGSDTSWVRLVDIDSQRARIVIEEEMSRDMQK